MVLRQRRKRRELNLAILRENGRDRFNLVFGEIDDFLKTFGNLFI